MIHNFQMFVTFSFSFLLFFGAVLLLVVIDASYNNNEIHVQSEKDKLYRQALI